MSKLFFALLFTIQSIAAFSQSEQILIEKCLQNYMASAVVCEDTNNGTFVFY